ncbi:MAG: thermonuclease family protein [Alphaproteobacteria bacterium]|nr:thermonuclease family protein [Alphaproteobacteria bacterium]
MLARPVLALALLWAGAAAAEAPIVKSVIDGDTVLLSTGKEVRFVGIQAPKLPLGRRGFPTWPLAPEAKAALEGLALGRAVELACLQACEDRHGRLLMHLTSDRGVWLQGEMLRLGLARVYTFADNRARAAEMLAIEADARAARRGIWALDYYAVRTPEQAGGFVGRYELVEGKVLAVASAQGTTFLNFGPDHRTDFTIGIDAAARKLFREAKRDPKALAGQTVRVRGWIKSRGGPFIEASHPEQIESLDPGR